MFSKLSTELVCIIISQLDSVQDLYSIICASTGIYAAFHGSKQIILSAVVRNVVGLKILPDALFATRVRQYPLLHAYGLRAALGVHETAMSLAEAEQISRLWHSCDYFVKKCSTHFLSKAERQAKSQDSKSRAIDDNSGTQEALFALSSLELRRIERAVWRYATFQSIFDDASYADKREVSRRVKSLFTDHTCWEIEEVACVNQYINDRLGDVFRAVDDHFVDSVRSKEQTSNSRYLPWGDEGCFDLESEEAEAPFFDSDDWIFTSSQHWRRLGVAQHLASLGLPFLRSLLEADLDGQKHMITKNYHCQTWSLHGALRSWPQVLTRSFETHSKGWKNDHVREFGGDDLPKRNQAWHWAHQNQHEMYFSERNAPLREWGYVFWDENRLQRWGILDDPWPLLFTDERQERYQNRPGPFEGPSAQERLRCLGLA
jgi:hypothetical protein